MMKKMREARFTSAKRMPEPTVRVVLRHDRYYPGGRLRGVVEIDLSSPVMATSLDLKLSGLETSFIGGLFGARVNPETRYSNYYSQYILLIGRPRKTVEQEMRHSLTAAMLPPRRLTSRTASLLTNNNNNTTNHNGATAAGNATANANAAVGSDADGHDEYSCAASHAMYADGEASHTMTRPTTAAGSEAATAASVSTEFAPTHLIAGTYTYPFELTLPTTLPPSVRITKSHDACSKLVYTASATLVLRSGKQYTKERTFTVLPLPVPLPRWLALHPENTHSTSASAMGSGNRLNSMTSQMLNGDGEATLPTVASTLTNGTRATAQEEANEEFTVCARRTIDHTRNYTADTIAREEALLRRRLSAMHNTAANNTTKGDTNAAVRNGAQGRPTRTSPHSPPPPPAPAPAAPAAVQTPQAPAAKVNHTHHAQQHEQQQQRQEEEQQPHAHAAEAATPEAAAPAPEAPASKGPEQNSYSMPEGAEDEVRAFNSPENENPIAELKSPQQHHHHRHRHHRRNNNNNEQQQQQEREAAAREENAAAQDAARVLYGRTGTFLQEAVPEAAQAPAADEDLTSAHNNNNNNTAGEGANGEAAQAGHGNGLRRRFGDLRGRLRGRFLRSESSSSSSSNSDGDSSGSSSSDGSSDDDDDGRDGSPSSALSRSGSLQQRKYNGFMKEEDEGNDEAGEEGAGANQAGNNNNNNCEEEEEEDDMLSGGRRRGNDAGQGSFSVAERLPSRALRQMQAFTEYFAIPLRRGILKRGTIALQLHVDRRVVVQGCSKVRVQLTIDTTHCTRSIQKIRLALIARGMIKSRMEEFEISRTYAESSMTEKVSKGAVAQLRPVELRVPHSTPITVFTEGYSNRVFLSVQLTIDGTLHNFVRSAEVELLVVRGVDTSGQSVRLLHWTNYFIGKDVSRSAITAPTVDARPESTTYNINNNNSSGGATITNAANNANGVGEFRKMTFVPLDAQYNGPPAFTDPLVGLNPFEGAGAAMAAAAEDNAAAAIANASANATQAGENNAVGAN